MNASLCLDLPFVYVREVKQGHVRGSVLVCRSEREHELNRVYSCRLWLLDIFNYGLSDLVNERVRVAVEN